MLRKLAILLTLAPWAALAQSNVNFGALPAAPSGYQNCVWQQSGAGTSNVQQSCYVPISTVTAPIYSSGAPTATCSSVVNLNVYGINTSTTPWSEYICSTGLSGYTWYQIGGGGGSGTITTVHNLDGTLTFSTSGTVVTGSLNLAQANTWSALQTFTAGIGVGASGTPTQFKTTFTCIQSGCSFGGVSGASTLAATTAASGFPGAGTYIWVGDGLTALDCSTGGGSVLHQCYYTGSAWTTATPAANINGTPCFMGGSCTISSGYTLPVATSSTLGGVKPDGTTIINSSGAISVAYGTTASTAAQGNDSRINGAVQSGGALGTPSSGTLTNTTGYSATALPAQATTVGSGAISVTANNAYVICSTTCAVTPLAPAAGQQLCVRNAPGSTTVITMAALGSGNYYELTTHAGWGTANHTIVSSGAATDSVCLVGYDANHYMIMSYVNSWTD